MLPEVIVDFPKREPLGIEVQRSHDDLLGIMFALETIALHEVAFAILAAVTLASLVLPFVLSRLLDVFRSTFRAFHSRLLFLHHLSQLPKP
jgi:hypothetical protein